MAGSKTTSPRPKRAAGKIRSNAAPLFFPIVAVGASAGGLEAFTSLLKSVPPRPGMAFVFIEHLDPKHESALASLLSAATQMRVAEPPDGTVVEPNHVYVIPPNKNMTIKAGALHLAPRSDGFGLQHPIDIFAISLAEERGSAAIGVVLSGSGSDGTRGLEAIKAAGGISFAQEPATAKWTAMPMSAMAAGAVDFVLPPHRIAAELARIGHHPNPAEAREIPEGNELDKICLILRASTGVDFGLYKKATVHRRIARRMALRKLRSLSKYAHALRQNQEEVDALADDILIHVTGFFREPECFQALRRRVLSKLAQNRPAGEPIRIWAAGCSTGEEVYSIAMLLQEELSAHASRASIQIFGTDIRDRAVEHARAGVYTEAAVKGVSPARLKRFFLKADHGYQISKDLRELCVFARHDLAKDPPFSKLDLVICRNVLVYMRPALQKRILSIFQYALKPGGFLFLGPVESLSEYSAAFAVEDRKNRIFSRTPVAAVLDGFDLEVPEIGQAAPAPARISVPRAGADLRQEIESILLEHYAPPAVMVDSDLRIAYFQGDTSPYLSPAGGPLSFHLLKMVRPELVADLAAAISEAKGDGSTVQNVQRDVHLLQEDHRITVRLGVRPLKRRDGKNPDFLVVFQKPEPAPGEEAKKPGPRGKIQHERAGRLERELTETREQLRKLITEHETAQGEMNASNEEIHASNEELHRTNEELETAREELQSSNEELETLNYELQHRNAELNVFTQDLTNLLVSVDIPVLVLDASLRIRRFTPVAGTLFNLIPSDIGRPFSDIATNLNVEDWGRVFAEAANYGKAIDREVSDRNGHRYSLRVRPYKTTEKKTEGVLVILLDVDLLYRARDEARKSGEYARAIVDTVIEGVAVLDSQLRVIATNRSFRALVPGLSQTEDHPLFFELAGGQLDVPGLRDLLTNVLSKRAEVAHFEIDRSFPELGRRCLVLNARPIDGTGAMLIAIWDLTPRKLAQEKAQTAEATIRSLLESSSQAIIAVDASEKMVIANGSTEKMFGYRPEELFGQPLEMLVPEEARERHIQHHRVFFRNASNRPMGIGLELEGRRKDGSTFPVEIGLSVIESPVGRLGVSFVTDISERKSLEQSARMHAEEVRALAAKLLTAQEEERRRVSRELHDQICQQLASLAMDIGGIAAEPLPPDTASRIRALQARAVRASEETRHIAYELHPSVLEDLGLVASLRDLCKDFSERSGIAAEFSSGALPSFLPREIAACFYRVSQEALQNVATHSKAAQVSIALNFDTGKLVLSIVDDGVGFDPDAAKGRGALGLVSMEERARLVNGTLSVASKVGEGTRIALEITLPPGKS